MRRAPPILAALLLAACSVDVEGARCSVPGAVEDCPSGQACGNDLRCTTHALACATEGTRCEVGAAHCLGGKERVERCSDVDPACGAWVVEECEAAGLECGTRGPAAACECPPYAEVYFSADPVDGSVAGAAPFPTGANTPAVCRFKRLGDALAAAKIVAGDGGLPIVQAHREAGIPVVFGDAASDETFPLEVAARVSLAGGGTDGPTIVRAEGATTEPLVRVQGWLTGFRIESVPTALAEGGRLAATGAGIAATCGAFNWPSMADVTVDGGGTLTRGIDVDVIAGTCGASLFGVDVSRIDGPALSVVGDPVAASRIIVTNGTFSDSETGIVATGGKLTIGSLGDSSLEVTGNTGEGIVLTGDNSRTLDVELFGAQVAGNGGAGVVLALVKPDSKLSVRGCTVYANGHASPREYGPGSPQRSAGGVFISQTTLAQFVFDANRVSSNAGDQLAFESSQHWSISTAACALANLFACSDGTYAVGVAGGGTVDASNTVWPEIPWGVFAAPGVTGTPYCNGANGAPALPASCPGH